MSKIKKASKEQIADIQQIDIQKGDWDSGRFPYFTNEQILKCLEHILFSMNKNILKLKKKAGIDPFIDDVGRFCILKTLLREMNTRFNQ